MQKSRKAYESEAMAHYLITGASSGIGHALAGQLADRGHRISALARRLPVLEKLATERQCVLPLQADVSDREQLSDAITRAAQTHGTIDTAILNAGMYQPVHADDFDIESYQRHMSVNYMGVVHALGAVLPMMRQRGHGHIVIIASVAGWRGLPRAAAYGPTKAALINLAESLWFDLNPQNIRIQLVCPGFVATEATAVNDFEMPGLMTADQAATAIRRGMASESFEITFPKGFARSMKLLRALPYRLFFPLVQKRTGAGR